MILNPSIAGGRQIKNVVFDISGVTCTMSVGYSDTQYIETLHVHIPPEQIGKMEIQVMEYNVSYSQSGIVLYVVVSSGGEISYFSRSDINYTYANIVEESKSTGNYSIEFYFDRNSTANLFPTSYQSPSPVWCVCGLSI